MKFSPEFIERVAEANNIVDIISQHTQLKSAGGGMMGRCPFPDHPEKTPSFSVSESKQVYHCFGCHKKGNIYTFLQQYNGMSFREAVEYLAGRANMALPQVNEEEAARQDAMTMKKRELAKVNKLAAQYFYQNFQKLPANHPVRQYADKRRLSSDIIQTFQIGYATDEWDGLVKFLESKNIPMSLAEEARLVKARTGGKSGYFDIFRDRLMFPILSTMGEPIAFGGRIILQGEPKYLNSPETLIFHKGKVLYGLSETAKYIRSEDQALVVEGYMDLVSLYQSGIQNVVATMGTALTADHGRLLHRVTKNIVVLFDGDSAGQEAAQRSLPILLAADVYPKGLVLPNGQDPDDYVKAQGAEALKAQLSQAPDLFTMILQMWMQGYRGEASEKVQLSTKLQPIFAAIQDQRLKKLYLSEAASRLQVEEKWLVQAVQVSPQQGKSTAAASFTNQSQTSSANSMQKPMNQGPNFQMAPSMELTEARMDQIQLKGATQAEALLLGLVLKNHANFQTFDQTQSLEEIPHEGVREVLKRAAEVYRQAPDKFDRLVSLLTSFVDRPDWLINQSTNLTGDDHKMILDCVRKIRGSAIQEKMKKLTLEMKSKVGPERMQELMMQISELKRQELNLKK